MKLKGAVRFRGLYTILTKGKGFELQGMIDRGDITRKYMEELMKIRAILVRFVHINYFGVDNSLTSTLTLLSGGRRGTSL